MRLSLAALAAGMVMVSQLSHAAKVKDYASEVIRLLDKEDFLGARVAARRMMRSNLAPGTWREVRSALHENPAVGWDLLRDWERISPNRASPTEVDNLLNEATAHLMRRSFQKAFEGFQDAARMIKKSAKAGNHGNNELYLLALHMMGRSLFGAGRFEEAYRVYSWIPATYSDFRRVTFERMWTAFRAKRISEAVGALASQHSSYLGPYLEPESYLVQIYIYRKLCRTEDLRLTLQSVHKFKKALTGQKFELFDWLRSDLTTRPYVKILEQKYNPSSKLVSPSERDSERERLTGYLAKRFSRERKRLLTELERVIAFSTMAFSASSKELPRVVKLPTPRVLYK